jgi:hypothetical protein
VGSGASRQREAVVAGSSATAKIITVGPAATIGGISAVLTGG